MENISSPDRSTHHSAAVSRDTIVHWSSRPVAAAVGQEVVLMNLDRGRCYGLGPTGTNLWQKMSSPVVVSDLLAALEREYDASPHQLETDVLQVLQQYADEGLIETRQPGDQ